MESEDEEDVVERKQIARKYSLDGATGTSSPLKNERGHRLSLDNESISIILDNIQ